MSKIKNYILLVAIIFTVFVSIDVYAGKLLLNFPQPTISAGKLIFNGTIINQDTTDLQANYYLNYGPASGGYTGAKIPLGEFYTGKIEVIETKNIHKEFDISPLPQGKVYLKIVNNTDKNNPVTILQYIIDNGKTVVQQGDATRDTQNGNSTQDTQHGDATSGNKLVNPIKADSLWGFIELVLGWIVKVGTILVGLFLLLAGFRFVSAQGNEEKLQQAKQGLLYTIIGAVLLLGAWTLATVISNTIEQIAK